MLDSDNTATPLPPDYYLRNFRCLLDQVMVQYQDLLQPQELAFHDGFVALTADAQMLLVRLLTRRGCLFRADRLSYSEITCVTSAATALSVAGFIAINPALQSKELLPLFSKAEWLQILRGLLNEPPPALRHMKREQFDQTLLELLPATYDYLTTPIYCLQVQPVFEVFKLLFFGNLHQDLTEFVLRDLGLYQYEPYVIDAATRLFTDRAQIERHRHYFEIIEELPEVLAGGRATLLAFYQQLPKPPQDDTVLLRRVQRVAFSLARQLERDGHWQDALAIYQTLTSPDARERCVRLLAKLERSDEALVLCRQCAQAPETFAEAQFTRYFGGKLAKQLNEVWPARSPYRPPQLHLQLIDTGHYVEVATQDHFAALEPCYYVENALFASVFGLHFWEVIFAPVRGAFTHPFQTGPHDLYHAEFTAARRDQLTDLLAAVPHMASRAAHYRNLWHSKFGRSNPFVHWHFLTEELLHLALERVPAAHWQAVFNRFLADLKNHCAGLPDLIRFPAEGGYELLEVKGPGDRLQKNQLAWMEYFTEHGIPHRVVNVTWRHD